MPKGDVKNKNHGLSQVHRITTNKYTASVQPVWSTNTKRGCFWKSWAAISTQHQLQQVHRISINKYTTSMPKGVAFETSWAGTSTQQQYQPLSSISNSINAKKHVFERSWAAIRTRHQYQQVRSIDANKYTHQCRKVLFQTRNNGLPTANGIGTNQYTASAPPSTQRQH